MIEQILDLAKFTGLEKSFHPHYQYEKPLEFYSLVNHYMMYNYNEKENPERYLTKLRYAVQDANKSIMADKLDIGIETIESDEFQKSMIELAYQYDDLYVNGTEVYITDSLKKSFVDPVIDKNFLYEKLAVQAYKTMVE